LLFGGIFPYFAKNNGIYAKKDQKDQFLVVQRFLYSNYGWGWLAQIKEFDYSHKYSNSSASTSSASAPLSRA
jgi:hypothetical protein